MALKILSRKSLNVVLRCTLQANGRLCFTTDILRELGLKKNQGVKFFEDEEGELYLAFENKVNEDNFPLTGAGRYLNLNTGQFFQTLGIDYLHNSIWFDLKPHYDERVKKRLYKMERHETPRSADEIRRIERNALRRRTQKRT